MASRPSRSRVYARAAGSPLRSLLDESQALEQIEARLQARIEQTVWRSEAWRRGDRVGALRAADAGPLSVEYEKVTARLRAIPGEIADIPAASLAEALDKLGYLIEMLEGDDAVIARSLRDDLERLGPSGG